MKLSGNFGVSGILAKEDERYQVIDNNTLNNLVLSSTNLNPGHSTSGHKHKGQEEAAKLMVQQKSCQAQDSARSCQAQGSARSCRVSKTQTEHHVTKMEEFSPGNSIEPRFSYREDKTKFQNQKPSKTL